MTPDGLTGVDDLLGCVINVSEGRDDAVIGRIGEAAGEVLLDVHRDGDHNRSVLTLGGEPAAVESAARRLARVVVAEVDLRRHEGAHPRLGALDVVPWVHLVPGPDGRLRDGSLTEAVAARDRFARWAAAILHLPCFLYGPGPLGSADGPDRAGSLERPGPIRAAGSVAQAVTLPELRREAWRHRLPDVGPHRPHPSAGAVCVGARPTLVAYNLWLQRADPALARRVAREIRSPSVRTLGLAVGDGVQVSCNLVAPWTAGPEAAFDAVAGRARVARAELVGLLPRAVLDSIPPSRWSILDVGESRTTEARLGGAGLDGGRFA